MSDLYKNCRWCNHFQNGECHHKQTFENNEMIEHDIYSLFENGQIHGAITEAFGKVEPDKNLVQKIDDVVTNLIYEKIQDAVENRRPQPVKPDEFYCKYFI